MLLAEGEDGSDDCVLGPLGRTKRDAHFAQNLADIGNGACTVTTGWLCLTLSMEHFGSVCVASVFLLEAR